MPKNTSMPSMRTTKALPEPVARLHKPGTDLPVAVLDSIDAVDAAEWNAVAGTQYPFLRHEFLAAAEKSGSVCASTGWQPRHLVLHAADGSLRAAMPLYEKSHSWGEFVFDWAWAEAYARAGLDYYPKLVAAVPFTPATSARLLLRDRNDTVAANALVAGALSLCRELQCSSLHIQFPILEELPILEHAGLIARKDCQFHWHNRDYKSFDAFLAGFRASKRKKARRDRRHVRESGIRFRRLSGRDLDEHSLDTVYELISTTFKVRGSLPYFNRVFFSELAAQLPDELLVIQAELANEVVAAAVFFVSESALYGRYWGSKGQHNALHFETCYYQGIEYCIERGIGRFEPGTPPPTRRRTGTSLGCRAAAAFQRSKRFTRCTSCR
jgi:predicted N-acyltransferase